MGSELERRDIRMKTIRDMVLGIAVILWSGLHLIVFRLNPEPTWVTDVSFLAALLLNMMGLAIVVMAYLLSKKVLDI